MLEYLRRHPDLAFLVWFVAAPVLILTALGVGLETYNASQPRHCETREDMAWPSFRPALFEICEQGLERRERFVSYLD